MLNEETSHRPDGVDFWLGCCRVVKLTQDEVSQERGCDFSNQTVCKFHCFAHISSGSGIQFQSDQ